MRVKGFEKSFELALSPSPTRLNLRSGAETEKRKLKFNFPRQHSVRRRFFRRECSRGRDEFLMHVYPVIHWAFRKTMHAKPAVAEAGEIP